MPTYSYKCKPCGWTGDLYTPVAYRDLETCPVCSVKLTRVVTAARIKNTSRNDADQFTADALGIPVNELPSGLKT